MIGSTSPQHTYNSRPPAWRQTVVPCAPHRSWDRSHRSCVLHNRQTAAHPPDGAGASPATACLPTGCKAHKTGNSRSLPCDRRDILPTAMTGSRPYGATRGGHAPTRAGSHDWKHHALSAEKSAAQGRCQTLLAAVARPPQRPEHDPDNPEEWCAQSPGSPQSVGSTDPRLTAVKHLGSSA